MNCPLFFLVLNPKSHFSQSILPRGFTGHEHFSEIALIHMNGRMYDPQMRRFLSPDNFVQEPYDTRSYDRFGYVWQNPLMLNDPSGEFILTALIVLGSLAVTSGIARGITRGGGIGGFFEGFGEGFVNTFKIVGGLFAFDSNLTVGQNIVNVISRFTWESPQTVVGLAYNLGHNLAGQVNWVKYKYGATVVQSRWQQAGITLGSYITGSTSIEADANNSLFQHEYGHVLQSRSSGLGYIPRFGIPSIKSSYSKEVKHYLSPSEQDANVRAFLYFNHNVKGFYKTEKQYKSGVSWGWNFEDNLIDRKGTGNQDQYTDYKNPIHLGQIRNLLVNPNLKSPGTYGSPFETLNPILQNLFGDKYAKENNKL